jgi:carboxyl-terminal processing protease
LILHQVTLTIRSHDDGAIKELPLARQRLTFNPVTSQLCKKVPLGEAGEGSAGEATEKVGYIRVATFSKQTTENVKAALHQLQAEGANRCLLTLRYFQRAW